MALVSASRKNDDMPVGQRPVSQLGNADDRRAKAELLGRFWGLYVHVCKRETPREAYALAKKNNGASYRGGGRCRSFFVLARLRSAIRTWTRMVI